MPQVISKPGPRPKSCLTCRRRRKKCDLSKPRCNRCLKGGIECLGYGDPESRAKIHQEGTSTSTLIASQARPISALDPSLARVGVVKSKAAVPNSIPKDWQDPTNADVGYDSRPSILGAALVYRLGGLISPTDNNNLTTDSSDDFDWSWPRSRSHLAVYSHSSTHQSSGTGQFCGTLSSAKPGINDLTRVVNALCQSIPPSVNSTQLVRQDHFGRVIHEYDLQRSSYWFTNPPTTIRRPLLAQLQWSKGMTWTIYLEARLFQALDQNIQTPGSTVRGYIGWIDKLQEKFTTGSHSNATLRDIADRLMIQLELTFLTFAVLNGVLGYNLLRKGLPKFLQIAAADSNLYTKLPNGNLVVSFPRTLSAPRYELRRFALSDTITSFILGLPPMVDYVYDGECDSGSHGLEWIHGIPVLLLQVIAQVNSWRASSRTLMEDWEALERRVLAWQPSSVVQTENSDTGIIGAARVAVQEGWRHVVLIYLYMGICGASSHDSRVQASAHRIFQLQDIAAKLPIGVHMFAHCVVAGLAARLEKHRVLMNEILLSFKGTRVWFFRGAQFSLVLCHLWREVGAGGAPVKWDDYVRSRCAVIPI